MKKILAISVSLCSVMLVIGFVAEMSWKEPVAHAGGAVHVRNGDVNGDGAIDISDAVYLLTNLFLGGDAPVPIECPPTVGKGLPATGQAKCYDNFGGEIDCAFADFPGQDGAYLAGCPSEGRFIDNVDGTVTDTCTGLMWQKETAPGTYTWQKALNYCESLILAGHDDWRLPDVRELQSIVDYGRSEPAIDPVFGVVLDKYWSSTSDAWGNGGSWYVVFNRGAVDHYVNDRANSWYVRAVRSGL